METQDIKKEFEKGWDEIRIKLETLYFNKVISFETLMNCIVLGRLKLGLPVVTRGIISVHI